jgi:hypothetical protein
LVYGFPNGYCVSKLPVFDNINDKGALHYAENVDKHIATELQHGAIIKFILL